MSGSVIDGDGSQQQMDLRVLKKSCVTVAHIVPTSLQMYKSLIKNRSAKSVLSPHSHGMRRGFFCNRRDYQVAEFSGGNL